MTGGILDGLRTPEELAAIRRTADAWAAEHPAEVERVRQMIGSGETMNRWSPSRTRRGPRIDEDPTPREAPAPVEAPAAELTLAQVVELSDAAGGKFANEDVTPALEAFASRWILRRDIVETEFLASMQQRVEKDWGLSAGQARGLLNVAVSETRRAAGRPAPAAPAAAPAPEPVAEVTDGMYLHEGRVVRAQYARANGSGQLYAKVLVSEEHGVARFEYAPGLVRRLRAEEKMTLAQAIEYGQLYGVCVRCGRTLTDEESIEAAMGRICRGKFDA